MAIGKTQSAIGELLDVLAALDLSDVPAVLGDNLFLIRDILEPVDVLGP